MTSSLNPFAWLAWSIAGVLIVVSTRNPLYLALALAATGVVYLSIDSSAQTGIAWTTVLRIAAVVSVISVLFNVLTVRAGDQILYRLPQNWPIIGGAATLNALLYGVASAMALLTLILVAATFSTAVDRAALLRIVPSQIASVGVAAIVGLSFFPQTLRAIHEVRAAQNARGFRVQSVYDVRPLIVPVLHLGLERAFNLAEAMESRGFGSGHRMKPRSSWLTATALILAVFSLGLLALGYSWAGLVTGALAVVGGILQWKWLGSQSRGQYRPVVWSAQDRSIVATSIVTVGLIVWAIGSSPSPLEWSPYPRLEWPRFSIVTGVACLLLIAPLLIHTRRRSS